MHHVGMHAAHVQSTEHEHVHHHHGQSRMRDNSFRAIESYHCHVDGQACVTMHVMQKCRKDTVTE
jgi:hypothetical protein